MTDLQTVQRTVLEEVKRAGRSDLALDIALGRETRLKDLGIDSMGVITLLLSLEEHIGIDWDRVAELALPETVDDLVRFAVAGDDAP